MKLLSMSMTGEELECTILSVLFTTYDIESSMFLAAMRDKASVNTVAMSAAKLLYTTVIDVGCFSFPHVGSNQRAIQTSFCKGIHKTVDFTLFTKP